MPPLERREGFGFAWGSIGRSSNCGGTARSIPDACTIRLERDLLERPSLVGVCAHVQTSAVPQETDQGVEPPLPPALPPQWLPRAPRSPSAAPDRECRRAGFRRR